MNAHHHLVNYVLERGLLISVYDGEEWPVKASHDAEEIIAAIESVEEAELRIRDQENNKIAWVLITPYGVAEDETVADHTDNDFMQDWTDMFNADHDLALIAAQ